jgi:alkaline phosphatase D
MQHVAARRAFLQSLALGVTTVAARPVLAMCETVSFEHGVASGDPLSDRVVLWTRVTPGSRDFVAVHWEVAEDARFRRVVKHGRTLTDESVDFTVKIDVDHLRPSTTYYYRFQVGRARSPVGRTKTLPKGHAERVKMVIFSCSNYPAGYFNVYREAALSVPDADVALHLGDYIYEYDADGYASEQAEAMGRVVDPQHEIFVLADYRRRYAQYRSDADLQLVHQKLPFIAVWDDHEVANDTWMGGAENHSPDEGDFFARKADAIQAYYEWMPVRETEPGNQERIYRSFDFGDLVSLHMLDTRVIGREEQLDYLNYVTNSGFDGATFAEDLGDPERTLLGIPQEQWLTAALAGSKSTWQVLGQQVLMGSLALPAPLVFQQVSLEDYQLLVLKSQTNPALLTPQEIAILTAPSVPLNLDSWDGYPAAREKVLRTAQALDKNLISLAGDTHNAWASDLSPLSGGAAGVEFAASSVSSPGFEEYLATIPPSTLAAGLMAFVSSLKYAETAHRGFLTLTLTHQQAVAEWTFVSTVKSKEYAILGESRKVLKVLPGSGGRRIVPV